MFQVIQNKMPAAAILRDDRALETAEWGMAGAAILITAYAAYKYLGDSIAGFVSWLASVV